MKKQRSGSIYYWLHALILFSGGLAANDIADPRTQDPLPAAIAAFDAFDLELANQHLDVAAKQGDSVDLRYYRTRIHALSNQPEAAQKEADACLELMPNASRCHEAKAEAEIVGVLLSGSLLSSFDGARAAKSAWERAIELDATNTRAALLLLRYCRQAPWVAGGSESQAREIEKNLVKINVAAGHQARGLNLLSDEKFDEALDALNAAIAADPADRDARFYVVQTLVTAERYDDAVIALRDLTDRYPKFADAWFTLAAVYWRGNLDPNAGTKALDRYDELARNPPKRRIAQALAIRGTLLLRAGNLEAARSAFNQALLADEDNELAQEGLESIN